MTKGKCRKLRGNSATNNKLISLNLFICVGGMNDAFCACDNGKECPYSFLLMIHYSITVVAEM